MHMYLMINRMILTMSATDIVYGMAVAVLHP